MRKYNPVNQHLESRKIIFVRSAFLLLILMMVMVSISFALGGDVLWQDQFDLVERSDFVWAMISDGDNLYVAGSSVNETDYSSWIVRAYDNIDGSLVWDDYFDDGASFPRPRSISVEDGKVIVGGSRNGGWTLRAHDASNGELIWDEQLENLFFKDVVSNDRKVIATGSGTDEAGNPVDLIRAYDSSTGNLLWQKTYENESISLDYIEVLGTKVVLAGSYRDEVGNINWLIKAIDIRNGVESWEDRFDLAGGRDQINSIAINNNNVYVIGQGLNEVGNSDWLVRAYNALDGSLQWQNQFDLSGDFDIAIDIAVSRDRIFVAGVSGLNDGSFNGDGIVRAYNAQDGTVIWHEQLDINESDNAFELIAVKGQQVIVAGTDFSLAGDYGWNVTSYDSTSGAILWQDDLVNNGIFDDVAAIATGNEQVFVAGMITQNGEWTDWLINAYSLR